MSNMPCTHAHSSKTVYYLPYNVDSFPTAKELNWPCNELSSGDKQAGCITVPE